MGLHGSIYLKGLYRPLMPHLAIEIRLYLTSGWCDRYQVHISLLMHSNLGSIDLRPNYTQQCKNDDSTKLGTLNKINKPWACSIELFRIICNRINGPQPWILSIGCLMDAEIIGKLVCQFGSMAAKMCLVA